MTDSAAADEEAVWALEELYWRYVDENDIANYVDLWHDDFVGWPGGTPHPIEKPGIADWIAKLHADPEKISRSEIHREAVRAFGDIVVVHYFYRGVFVSKETGERVGLWARGKITHTWLRCGDSWKIITGMAGRLKESETGGR
ncbi:MAG: nuclear transport factor 2 family protein [Pseudomonadota bacterium]